MLEIVQWGGWLLHSRKKHPSLYAVDFLLWQVEDGLCFSSWRGRTEKESACLLSQESKWLGQWENPVSESLAGNSNEGWLFLPAACCKYSEYWSIFNSSRFESNHESFNERLECISSVSPDLWLRAVYIHMFGKIYSYRSLQTYAHSTLLHDAQLLCWVKNGRTRLSPVLFTAHPLFFLSPGARFIDCWQWQNKRHIMSLCNNPIEAESLVKAEVMPFSRCVCRCLLAWPASAPGMSHLSKYFKRCGYWIHNVM